MKSLNMNKNRIITIVNNVMMMMYMLNDVDIVMLCYSEYCYWYIDKLIFKRDEIVVSRWIIVKEGWIYKDKVLLISVNEMLLFVVCCLLIWMT